ncbi:flagellar basal body P-ring formation protein FlgA [Desulfopila sp. IMCC35006]|uniref:flagellar basal body P-ring formation chaperone FlgA n=1 Tax=Desulfopila sp. IMCC35006 TaxID=2569542 RepID=UPI0010AB8A8E|nr:flagellar basal body P-ring formation chaperone FlgA [Desulfopila sp. IMCC35006]TKB25817.1 flagellar basal body P-ring formation protein FlgA [Desulfopila sp. IMCC35006]
MQKVFIIVCLLFGSVQIASALEITFKPNSSVDDSVIRLGDIVSFDQQTEMAKALATQQIGQAPAPGETITLSSISIKDHIAASQTLPQDIQWTGSPTVAILRSGIDIGPERIQTIIADYIKKNQNDLPEAEIRFVPESLPLPFTLPTGDLSYDVTPSNPAILGSSRFSIIFRVNDTVVKNMSVRGKIEALAQVVVCAGNLNRGEILRPQHLKTALMDISAIENPCFEPNDLIGQKLQRSLRAGSPVLLSMVETLPIVRRGERVKIVINSGPLHLSATGLANSDGALNEMIRVRNINSNKMVYCRVAAPGLVEVML